MADQATDTASAALLELAKDWRAQADRMEQSSRHNRLFSNVWHAHADELERALASLPAPAAPEHAKGCQRGWDGCSCGVDAAPEKPPE